jgi:hypothetical protein
MSTRQLGCRTNQLVPSARATILAAWHEHLKESRDGGYTWGRNIKLPKIMKEALASRAWREAVGKLEVQDVD